MICLFNWVIFRFDAYFPECNFFNCFFVRNFHGEKKQTKDFEPQKKGMIIQSVNPIPPLQVSSLMIGSNLSLKGKNLCRDRFRNFQIKRHQGL